MPWSRHHAVRSGTLRRGDSGAGEVSPRSAQPRRGIADAIRTRRSDITTRRWQRSGRRPRSLRTRLTFASISRCTTRVEQTGAGRGRASAREGPFRDARSTARVEALARIRERQGRAADAIALYQKAYALRSATPAELIRLGQLAMSAQQTPLAIESFEKARSLQGAAFAHNLELGVVFLAARRLPEARDSLDRGLRRIPSTRWRSSSAPRSACC